MTAGTTTIRTATTYGDHSSPGFTEKILTICWKSKSIQEILAEPRGEGSMFS